MICGTFRRSYISGRILLNLLNDLKKRYHLRGLLSILSFLATRRFFHESKT